MRFTPIPKPYRRVEAVADSLPSASVRTPIGTLHVAFPAEEQGRLHPLRNVVRHGSSWKTAQIGDAEAHLAWGPVDAVRVPRRPTEAPPPGTQCWEFAIRFGGAEASSLDVAWRWGRDAAWLAHESETGQYEHLWSYATAREQLVVLFRDDEWLREYVDKACTLGQVVGSTAPQHDQIGVPAGVQLTYPIQIACAPCTTRNVAWGVDEPAHRAIGWDTATALRAAGLE